MSSLRPGRSSAGLVVAVIALIVALGGTSYAAFSLPKNSVGAKQLKNSAVTGKKIAKNAITSSSVKDGSLDAADFKAGKLPSGPQGPKGDPGIPGPKGDPGAPGSALGYAHVVVTAGGAAIDSSRSQDMASAKVSRVSQGITCVSGLPFTPKSVTVTTDASTGNGIENATSALAPDAGVISLCGPAGQAAVITGQGNTAQDATYYVVFN